MYEYLDRRYALALYEVAEKKGKVKEYLQDLEEICDLIKNDKDFYETIKHPQISTKNKKKLFIRIFKGRIDEELLSFLLILIEKDRLLFLREKLNQMKKIDDERNDILRGIVVTTSPLSEEKFKQLNANLNNKYKKKVILTQKIDKSIIGGIYLRVDNEIIDNTIKSKLDDLKDIMLNME